MLYDASDAAFAVPKQIDIEVSSRCNLRCVGCPINDQADAGTLMDYDLFTSIVDRSTRWDCTLVPWLNGEPLIHPRYADMIDYIIRKRKRAYITTNGHFWREDVFERITEPDSTIYQIIFSLDGLPHNFSKSAVVARPGSNKALVINTITRFMAMAKAKDSNIDIAVKLVKRGQDWEEIENYIAYFLCNPNIAYVCVGEMLDQETDGPMRIYPCRYSDNMFMVIRTDGEVVACSYHPQAHNDNYFEFGNVRNDEQLLNIYNNPKMIKFRNDQRAGIFTGPCERCGFAYTGAGFAGYINFRDQRLNSKVFTKTGSQTIRYQRDYYNHFFSVRQGSGNTKSDHFYSYHAADTVSHLYP